jgi:hypothetical protein
MLNRSDDAGIFVTVITVGEIVLFTTIALHFVINVIHSVGEDSYKSESFIIKICLMSNFLHKLGRLCNFLIFILFYMMYYLD